MTTSALLDGTAEFPITWERPEDARLAWWFERWHSPRPFTPLSADVGDLVYRGMNGGRRATRVPGAVRGLRMNTYMYMAIGSRRPGDPEPFGAEPQPDRLQNHATWDALWLPELQEYLRRWDAFDRAGVSNDEFLRHLDDSTLWFQRCWEIHSRLDFSREGLSSLVGEALGWTAEEARELVAGVESKSIEADDALLSLARLAASQPAVRDAILDLPSDQVFNALRGMDDAAQFRAQLAQYLEQFGRRSDDFHELATPAWAEDPRQVFAMLKAHVRQPDYDPRPQREAVAARRAAAQDRARAELAERAPDRLEAFEQELTLALRASALNEDHNYWLDQQTLYWMRTNMVEAGKRLSDAGLIAERDDVFMLTLEEIRDGLASQQGDFRLAVEERRAEMQRWSKVEPLPQIGAELPPEARALVASLFGQTELTSVAGQVRGLGASRGVATGRARVIRSLDEGDRLGPGDVLVTESTTPPWTALFGLAVAIVTDGGGPLSHAAVVAREYGIPAVVGTMTGSKLITDGQVIRVDGSAGTVDLVADS